MGFVSCDNHSSTKILSLAHGLPTDHPVHIAMEYMANKLDSLSDGQLKIRMYPSGQLGSEQQNVELLQIGSLAMTKVSAAVLEGFAQEYKALGLPYIFRSKAHYYNVCDGAAGKRLLASTKDKKLQGLAFYDAGSRSFYSTKKMINKPSDLDGMKIRVMKSKTAMDMVNGLGGSATPISWGELYTALQSGVVDGAENNPPSFYTSHQYEVCKYYALDEHSSIPDVLVMSSHIYENLTDQEKSWLHQAAEASVVLQRQLWAAAELNAMKEMKKAGVKISYPDKKPFADMLSGMYDAYKSNEKIQTLITQIKNTK